MPQIAACQINSWQAAYRGILADTFLDQAVPRILLNRWSRWPGFDWRVDVACDETALVGFVSTDLAHEGGPYVDNLHVSKKGQGLGRHLMRCAARHALDHNRLWLTVMTANAAARAFYARLSGVEGDEMTEKLYGQPVQTRPVVWTDTALKRLAS